MLPPDPIRSAIEQRLGLGTPGAWSLASGGLSDSAVWRVAEGDRAFAVRRWSGRVDPRWLTWSRALTLGAVRAGLDFVPEPLENDRWPYSDSAGGLWDAATWRPGEPLTRRQSPAAVASAAGGLAALHGRFRALATQYPAPVARAESRVARLQRLPIAVAVGPLHAEVWPELDQLPHRLASALPCVVRAVEAVDEASWEQQPVHGDARPEHFLLNGDGLTGLIDFGAVRIDTALADVARLAGEFAGGDAARFAAVVEAYAAAAGRPIDVEAVRGLDQAGAVIAGHNWLRWLSDPAFTPRDPDLVGQRLRSILARLPG